MVNHRSMNLWAVCWLGLALLVVFPGSASAQRRGRYRGDGREEYDDPICYTSPPGLCQKFRVELLGGGIFSTDGAAPAEGLLLGYSWVVGPRFEIGGNLFFMKDFRYQDSPYLGSVEALFRVATMARPYQRFFLEFGLGGSRYDSTDKAYWAFPSASGGATLEVSGPGLGIFISGGLSLMWAEGVAALPHAGVGLVF